MSFNNILAGLFVAPAPMIDVPPKAYPLPAAFYWDDWRKALGYRVGWSLMPASNKAALYVPDDIC